MVRIYNGMTQQELADSLGVTKANISSYEQNKSMPNYNKLIEIARMFNVTTDYMLSHGDEYLDERFKTPPVTEISDDTGKTGRLNSRRMGIGSQIKELREERGLSRQELADGLSLSVTTIGKYENDIAAPSYGTLIDIASYFGVSTERLFGIDTGRKLDIRALPEDKKELIKNLVGGMK